ncbi:hypothetical protein A2U01_0105902, partial [Trifolium medium]|nr:hypothetical protein [Trifolium medium]
ALARDGDALAQRRYSSLSDASSNLRLSLENGLGHTPNPIFTTFDP